MGLETRVMGQDAESANNLMQLHIMPTARGEEVSGKMAVPKVNDFDLGQTNSLSGT